MRLRRAFSLVPVGLAAVSLSLLVPESWGLSPRALMSQGLAAEPAAGKVMGAASCSATDCHGGKGDTKNQYTLWSTKDPHANSYKLLLDERGQTLAKSMGIDDPATSQTCLRCHALEVPAARRGPKYNLKEGNTCEQCHGPAEKWLTSHAKPGWTREKSVDAGAQDTSNTYERVKNCVGCHVGIDRQILASGHTYDAVDFGTYQTRITTHWAPQPAWETTKAWAIGQALALQENLLLVAESVATDGMGPRVAERWYEAYGRYLTLRAIGAFADRDSMKSMEGAMQTMRESVKKGERLDLSPPMLASNDAVELAKAFNELQFNLVLTRMALESIPDQAAELAGGDFPTAWQFTWSLATLSGVLQEASAVPGDLLTATGALFEVLSKQTDKFDAAAFAKQLAVVEAEAKK